MRVDLLAGAALAVLVAVVAPQAAGATQGCSNEQLRDESNVNPATHEPYDLQLPECRAYEMVSPLNKQGHDALSLHAGFANFVSPEGEAIEWASEGAYAGAENYKVEIRPDNSYVARRSDDEWVTQSAYPPIALVEEPTGAFNAAGTFSPALTVETVCGDRPEGSAFLCALGEPGGAWSPTPEYLSLEGSAPVTVETRGASRSGNVYVFQAGASQHLLASDNSAPCGGKLCGGLYALSGIGTPSPELKLVNVNNNGEMIGSGSEISIGASPSLAPYGGAYQAVSDTGTTIFFTATPQGGTPTVYARINGSETVNVSDPSPSECTTCIKMAQEGRFEGASDNGEKVFFTTSQQLLDADTDMTTDLYEYDFAKPSGHELTQVSAGGFGDATPGTGAEVEGVVAVSEDGSHVYFVARGVLTTLANGVGETATQGADNLYGFDTNTGETKFVAQLAFQDKQLWGQPVPSGTSGIFDARTAQATSNGAYLVFDSFAPLISTGIEATTSGAQQVYRYDFATGDLVRVSVGHEGYASDGNVPSRNASVPPIGIQEDGAAPTINDMNRAITENGTSIAFVSAARLDSKDAVDEPTESCVGGSNVATGAGCGVYLWHECADAQCSDGNAGEVSLISDGTSSEGVVFAGMGASGVDLFFQTRAQLVGQDTDELGDIYDARIDGGFPAPTPEASCIGEECQGQPAPGPTFTTPNSITTTPSGNISFATVESSAASVKITGHTSKSVSVSVPAGGSLALSGAGLIGARKTATKAGTYTLALKLTKTGRKLLAKHGHVTLIVTVRFTPTTGAPSTATAKFTIKAKSKKSKTKR